MQDTKFKRHLILQLCKVTGILAVILLLTPVVSQPAFSQAAEHPRNKPKGFRGKVIEEKTTAREFPKIDYSLIKIRNKLRDRGITKENAQERNAKKLSTPLIKIDNRARIQVYVHVTSTGKEKQARLRREGLKIEIVNDRLGIIQGWLPKDALETVARLPFVKRITPPSYGTPKAGSVTTEGDGVLLANELRALGFNGTGVRVGVISDGVDNMADSVATDDLLSGITVFGDCNVATTCNEGTAMLEIVHDLAPGAELGFGAAGMGTTLDFITRIDNLMDFGADIIVDDIGFFNEPYFEDGPVADRVREAAESGIVYVSAAGNEAEGHHEAEFTSTELLALGGPEHNFGLASGGLSDVYWDFQCAPLSSITVFLQWNDPWGSTSNDYDVLLVDAVDTILAAGVEIQDGDDNPLEIATYTNLSLSEELVGVVVYRFSGESRRLELLVTGDCVMFAAEPNIAAGSIFGHPTVSDVIAVGAISAADDEHDTIESFSSQGPSEIFFPEQETRQKPDIAAIDGVSITGAGGFPNPFFGTSAAAPHVAGLAALLMEVSPTATPEEIRNALRNSAVDLGDLGFDSIFGAGRADVRAAAELLNVAPESTIDGPASNTTIDKNGSVTFSGICTDANSTEGMTFSWSFGAGSGIAASSGEDPGAVVFGNAGTFTVAFTCTDGFGLADASPPTKTITVVEPATAAESPSDEPEEPAEEPATSSPTSGGCSLINKE